MGLAQLIITPASDIGVDTYDEPFRVHGDKDQAAGRLPVVTANRALPGESEFSECISWCYAAAIMAARCVARDEPWLAKGRDWDAKQELLKMIEWDHRARYGAGFPHVVPRKASRPVDGRGCARGAGPLLGSLPRLRHPCGPPRDDGTV